MANSYKFAVIRYAPEDVRAERLNVGAIVFSHESSDVYVAKKLDKIHAMSAAIETESLRQLIMGIAETDNELRLNGVFEPDARIKELRRYGPLELSAPGEFVAESSVAYDNRVMTLLRYWVDPEPALKREKEKRSRLIAQIKQEFRSERVLARSDEGLDTHRIVPNLALDEGFVADFALQNSKLHIAETVDAAEEEGNRKVLGDISVAALVLERARLKFGAENISRKLIYRAAASVEKVAASALDVVQDQGAELVNWASDDDRRKFLNGFLAYAQPRPLPKKGKRPIERGHQSKLFS